jgi:hypothetical protein
MNKFVIESPFRLSKGGLFYGLLLRLRLIKENRYYPWRRIVLFAGLTWLPLLVMTAIDGTLAGGSAGIAFLQDPVPHTRFLIALPLLVFAAMIIDPSVASVVRHFQICDLVPDEADPHFRKAFEKLVRQRDAAWIDVALIVLAFGLVWISTFKFGHSTRELELPSWASTAPGNVEMLTSAGRWFVLVSTPFILFVLFRWIWRLIIWIGFMNRISRLRLALQSTHPDKVGGLGLLTEAQFSFGVIFAAVGAMMSSTLASEIIHSGRTLSDVQWEIIGFVLISFAIITGPLCTFFSQLFGAKRRGLMQYSALAYQLSEAFQTRWIRNSNDGRGDDLVTAVDPSAVADYSVIYETVSNIRLIPIKKQKVIGLIIILVAPFIPLIFTQISIKDALQRLAQTFV